MITKLTGLTFRQPEINNLRPEGAVELKKETDEKILKLDTKAICVYWKGHHIGYLPKGSDIQEEVFGDLSSSRRIKAQIEEYSYLDNERGWNNDHKGKLQSISINIQTHLGYQKEGKEYASITKLLSHLNPEGNIDGLLRWAIAAGTFEDYEKKLNTAADNGTKLHKGIEEMFKGKREDSLPIANFRKRFSPKVINLEEVVFDNKNRIAGTYDALMEINGKKVMIDWKSGKKCHTKYLLQASFYRKLVDADEAWIVYFGGTQKQGYGITKLKPELFEKYYNAVVYLKKIYDILNE